MDSGEEGAEDSAESRGEHLERRSEERGVASRFELCHRLHGFTHLQMWLCGWVSVLLLLGSTHATNTTNNPSYFLGPVLRAGPRCFARCLVPQLAHSLRGLSAPPLPLLGETRRQDANPKETGDHG